MFHDIIQTSSQYIKLCLAYFISHFFSICDSFNKPLLDSSCSINTFKVSSIIVWFIFFPDPFSTMFFCSTAHFQDWEKANLSIRLLLYWCFFMWASFHFYSYIFKSCFYLFIRVYREEANAISQVNVTKLYASIALKIGDANTSTHARTNNCRSTLWNG